MSRDNAIKTARALLSSPFVCLDTETTGLGDQAEIIELAIIDQTGATLFNRRFRPHPSTPFEDGAVKTHGITREVLADCPDAWQSMVVLRAILNDQPLVTYNLEFDLRMIRQTFRVVFASDQPRHCAMLLYAEFCDDWDERRQSYRWQRLPGGDHTALGDARATLALLRMMAETPLSTEAPQGATGAALGAQKLAEGVLVAFNFCVGRGMTIAEPLMHAVEERGKGLRALDKHASGSTALGSPEEFALLQQVLARHGVNDTYDAAVALRRLEGERDELRAEVATLNDDFSYLQKKRDELGRAIDEGHGVLTAAGIPTADRVVCDDPACHSKIGHRIRALAGERDRLAVAAQQAEDRAGRLGAVLQDLVNEVIEGMRTGVRMPAYDKALEAVALLGFDGEAVKQDS